MYVKGTVIPPPRPARKIITIVTHFSNCGVRQNVTENLCDKTLGHDGCAVRDSVITLDILF